MGATTGGNIGPENTVQVKQLGPTTLYSAAGVDPIILQTTKKHLHVWVRNGAGNAVPAALVLWVSSDPNGLLAFPIHVPIEGTDFERFSRKAHGPDTGMFQLFVWGFAAGYYLTVMEWE